MKFGVLTEELLEVSTGDYLDGKYRVEKKLGEGSYGIVYKVSDGTGTYALKILKLWLVPADKREKMRDRFIMEYETGKIDCKYLVHTYTIGEIKGNPYILMEFCSKGDLLRVPEETDWNLIAHQVLYGLKSLHASGKVHRDLKPENVLIRADGTAALSDFGISGDRRRRMTIMGDNGAPAEIFGTIPYMPPEQLIPGNREVTILPTTDIFSFGVMMYWLFVGEFPFGQLRAGNHDDLARYTNNVRNGKWNKSALRGHDFYDAIDGCLQPDYTKRLQSVDNVLAMLPPCPNVSIDSLPVGTPVHPSGYLLRVMQGEEYGKTYDLTEMFSCMNFLVGGRKDSFTPNDIQIKEVFSNYISRKHFTIEKHNGGFIIKDGQRDVHLTNGWRNSTNGTFVNSTEVTKNGYPLSIGDIISIGDVKLRFEARQIDVRFLTYF